jgi:hypothetical protein
MSSDNPMNSTPDAILIPAALHRQLVEALEDAGQLIVWHHFGECRGITERRIETPADVAATIKAALTALRAAAPAEAKEPKSVNADLTSDSVACMSVVGADALPAPLPYDVTVGGMTFRKGVDLNTFVMAAQRWHREAFPDIYALTDEQKAENLARLQGIVATAADQSDVFFDGGWCWMRHPEYNDGNAVPVYMEQVDGGRWFRPCAPEYAQECEWDRRNDEWEMVEGPMAQSDAAFDLFCARAAGGHLASRVDELTAEVESLRAALSAPAPAPAGEAKKDSERLDWLMHNISGAELRRLGIMTSAGVNRENVDAAMKEPGNAT